jgi:hypothetical protein
MFFGDNDVFFEFKTGGEKKVFERVLLLDHFFAQEATRKKSSQIFFM